MASEDLIGFSNLSPANWNSIIDLDGFSAEIEDTCESIVARTS